MTDQDFQKHIELIEGELQRIRKNTHAPVWRSFFTGALSGIGSVIGVAIALAFIAWILNSIGVIPAFRGEVTRLNKALDQIQKIN